MKNRPWQEGERGNTPSICFHPLPLQHTFESSRAKSQMKPDQRKNCHNSPMALFRTSSYDQAEDTMHLEMYKLDNLIYANATSSAIVALLFNFLTVSLLAFLESILYLQMLYYIKWMSNARRCLMCSLFAGASVCRLVKAVCGCHTS